MKSHISRRAALAVAMVFALTRCAGDTPTAPGIVSVTITPPSATLRVGATVQVTTSVVIDGVAAPQAVSFTSDNTAVVSVSAAGLVRALSIGTATITGTAATGQSAKALVTVIAGLPTSVTKTGGDNQTAVAGSALAAPPSVTVRDSAGNAASGVGVTFVVVSGGGSIAGGAATTNAAGVATAGTWTLGATAGGNSVNASVAGLAPVTFAATATTAPAFAIVIGAGNGQSATTGTALAIAPSVRITSAAGQPVAGVTVTFAVAAGGGSVSGATQTTDANGVATVGSYLLGAVGANSLTATASVGSVTFNATATAGSSIVLSQAALSFGATLGGAAAGTATVTITNGGGGILGGIGFGTIVYSAGASSWLSATLSGSVAPASISFSATAAGLAAGTYTAIIPIVSSTATNSPQNIVATLTVSAVALPVISVTSQPAGTTTGAVLTTQPTVQILNGGSLATSFNAPITASLVSGFGTLSGTTTVSAVNGVARFTDLRITGSGNFMLMFSGTGLTSGTSAAFAIAALPATRVIVTTGPAGAATNLAFTTQPRVELRDINGGLVSNSTAAVTASLDPTSTGTGILSGTLTVNAVNGVAQFTNLKLSATGTYVLQFGSAGLTAGNAAPITVTLSPPSSIAVITQPGGAVTGAALTTQPAVELRDISNAVVAGSSAPVTATLVGSGGALSGTTTVNAVNGIATFTDLKVTGAGTYTLNFASAGTSIASSAPFAISSLPATQLAIQTAPSGGSSGVAFTTQPVIQVRDANNGVVAGAVVPVTAALVGSGGTLSGTTTVNAVNGVATFNDLKISGPGSYSITFSASGLAAVSSGTLTVGQVASAVVITTQPAGANNGVNFTTQPVVELRDAAGVKVLSAISAVTASLNGAGGSLAGTLTVNAVNGVATFTNLKISGGSAPFNVTLNFTGTGLTAATSSSFTVAAAPAASIAFNVGNTTPVAGTVGADLAIPIVVNMVNANGQNLAAITFDLTWDPGKFDYVGRTNGSFGSGPSYTVNVNNTSTGKLTVSISDNDGFSTGAPTILTVTLKPKVTGSGVVNASVSVAGSDLGSSIPPSTFVVRPLTVNTP